MDWVGLGYGVMVAQDILVVLVLVRNRIAQPKRSMAAPQGVCHAFFFGHPKSSGSTPPALPCSRHTAWRKRPEPPRPTFREAKAGTPAALGDQQRSVPCPTAGWCASPPSAIPATRQHFRPNAAARCKCRCSALHCPSQRAALPIAPHCPHRSITVRHSSGSLVPTAPAYF